jgi:RNA polymerase sigma-70 factor, ECF subfamily
MHRATGSLNAPPPSTGKDASLLARVQSGDEKAMASLYDRYSMLVYSVALRVLRDPVAAEDVLQEVFMQIWRNPDSFTAAGEGFAGWLAIVARNRSVDTLRRKRPLIELDGLPLTSAFDLAKEAERNSVMERARGAIRQLPSEQRKTLDMAFFDGLTHSEIAEVTGNPPAAVKSRIRNALLALRTGFQA